MSIENSLQNMIVQCRVTRVSGDSETYPSAQVSYLSKTANVTRLNPYPIISNPPSRALGLKLNNQAQEQNRYAFFHDPANRLKNLREGEGGLHNSLTGSYILLDENSDIQVVSKRDLVAQITRDVIANFVDGSLTGTGTLDVEVPTINLTGNVNVDGDFKAQNGVFTHNGTNVGDDHKHSGVTTGASNTGNPI